MAGEMQRLDDQLFERFLSGDRTIDANVACGRCDLCPGLLHEVVTCGAIRDFHAVISLFALPLKTTANLIFSQSKFVQ
jgi:hypothetical protein